MDAKILLKRVANAYMAATLAARVTVDVVKSSPYQAAGVAALCGVMAGIALNAYRRSSKHGQ